ncbi:cytochrome b/b6 domain-containing protein [Shewanella seohaensis]|uniref:cytochrome b/b6 domain-containing protein n=1 Tax=Shewanella seohaensis TaxID=755175 RepID=UPI00201009EE|nr:cytochrome b/b6 domain-containing protein [Shewanella seohaensis]MCL1119132.1 cytochrome b/b6 domain-containing protein [Shewanella seohaensis]UXM81747.1 cytochrome b/b6 domain-containing protein [Shewanella seohaensis]
MSANVTQIFDFVLARLHLWIVLSVGLLVCTSPWIFIGRSLRANASIWDYLHVYLGLIATALGILFLLRNSIQGKWHQYFAWLVGDWGQLIQDVKGLFKGKLPVAGGKGLFSTVEGIGMLLLVATGMTGALWFFYQGTPLAMTWRGYHQVCADVFIGFLVVHLVLAASHIIEFIRQ